MRTRDQIGRGLLIVTLALIAPNRAWSQPTLPGSAGLAAAVWPMLGSSPGHTSLSTFRGPDQGELAWRFEADAPVDGGVAIDADGSIFFGTSPAYGLYTVPLGVDAGVTATSGALDVETDGSSLAGLPNHVSVGAVVGVDREPVRLGVAPFRVDAGEDVTIPFSASGGTFYSLEQNGGEKWRVENLSPMVGVPALGRNGHVYIGSVSGRVYAFDIQTGEAAWTFRARSPVTGSIVVDGDGTIYFPTLSNGLFAVSPEGALVWQAKVGRVSASSPALGANGDIVIGTADGRVVAINPAGQIRWNRQVAPATTALGSPTVAEHGLIYIGGDDGELRALEPVYGQLRWSYVVNAAIRGGISLGMDRSLFLLHFADALGGVYGLLDFGYTAGLLWYANVGSAIVSTPVVDRSGAVFVGAEDGNVYAVAGDGDGTLEVLHSTNGGALRSALAIGVGGRVFVGSADHGVYAIGNFRAGEDCWSEAFLSAEGMTEAEANKRFHSLLAACGGPDVDSALAIVQGNVNATRVDAAAAIISGNLSPSEYLDIIRYFSNRLEELRRSAFGWKLRRVAAEDEDGDLVDDPSDLCPGTPPLTPVDPDGCTHWVGSEAPPEDLVRKALDGLGWLFDPKCDDKVPQVPAIERVVVSPWNAQANEPISVYLYIAQADNQQPGCGVWYEIQAFSVGGGGPRRAASVVIPRWRGSPNVDNPNTVEFLFRTTDPDPGGALAEVFRAGEIHIRFRATNYAGARSIWGPWLY